MPLSFSRSAMTWPIASAPAALPPRTLPLNVFFSAGSVLAAAATVLPAMSSITCA